MVKEFQQYLVPPQLYLHYILKFYKLETQQNPTCITKGQDLKEDSVKLLQKSSEIVALMPTFDFELDI